MSLEGRLDKGPAETVEESIKRISRRIEELVDRSCFEHSAERLLQALITQALEQRIGELEARLGRAGALGRANYSLGRDMSGA